MVSSLPPSGPNSVDLQNSVGGAPPIVPQPSPAIAQPLPARQEGAPGVPAQIAPELARDPAALPPPLIPPPIPLSTPATQQQVAANAAHAANIAPKESMLSKVANVFIFVLGDVKEINQKLNDLYPDRPTLKGLCKFGLCVAGAFTFPSRVIAFTVGHSGLGLGAGALTFIAHIVTFGWFGKKLLGVESKNPFKAGAQAMGSLGALVATFNPLGWMARGIQNLCLSESKTMKDSFNENVPAGRLIPYSIGLGCASLAERIFTSSQPRNQGQNALAEPQNQQQPVPMPIPPAAQPGLDANRPVEPAANPRVEVEANLPEPDG